MTNKNVLVMKDKIIIGTKKSIEDYKGDGIMEKLSNVPEEDIIYVTNEGLKKMRLEHEN